MVAGQGHEKTIPARWQAKSAMSIIEGDGSATRTTTG
jgi:hypothetical protein